MGMGFWDESYRVDGVRIREASVDFYHACSRKPHLSRRNRRNGKIVGEMGLEVGVKAFTPVK